MGEDLAGKVVLITGGTSGIGLAAAALFLRQGARVVINGRDFSRGRQALEELQPISEDVLFVQGDVSQHSDCERIVREAARTFAGLNIVVNSAGVYLEKLIADTTAADLQAVLGTNINGTYCISKFAVPEMRRAGGGSIINMSSDAGLRGNLLCSAYCAAKGAVISLTRALALEAAPYNIRVNCVCPGDVATPMLARQLSGAGDSRQCLDTMESLYPLGRIASPEEVAKVICFLASSSASFVTGAIWTVDGGLTAG